MRDDGDVEDRRHEHDTEDLVQTGESHSIKLYRLECLGLQELLEYDTVVDVLHHQC